MFGVYTTNITYYKVILSMTSGKKKHFIEWLKSEDGKCQTAVAIFTLGKTDKRSRDISRVRPNQYLVDD